MRPGDALTGCFGELHAAVGSEPVNRLNDVDHVALAGFGCADAEINAAAVDARRGFLFLVLGLIHQNGDQVLPLFAGQLFAVPDNLVRQVLQQWPHKTVLLIGARLFSGLDHHRRARVYWKGANVRDEVVFNALTSQTSLTSEQAIEVLTALKDDLIPCAKIHY